MKVKVLKISIYVLGGICLFAFIAVRNEQIFNLVLKEPIVKGYWDDTKYGELYYFSHINHFKEENLPRVGEKFQYSKKQSSLNDADIIIIGDSFLDMCKPTQFPAEIAKRMNKNVHFVHFEYPMLYLSQQNYCDTTPKIMLYESAERLIPVRFKNPPSSDYEIDNRSNIRKFLNKIRIQTFYERSEELYDVMLKRSYPTTWIYGKIATLKFDLFGYISKLTPLYSLNDSLPWLFYHEEVNNDITSFYYQHTEEEIENISKNIADLALQLKNKFNIELIFLPIPGKYTLYHQVINNDSYNNLLPKLYIKLDEKGIKYIDLYSTFKKSKELLYIPTDGHWNTKGLELGLQLTIDYFDSNNIIKR